MVELTVDREETKKVVQLKFLLKKYTVIINIIVEIIALMNTQGNNHPTFPKGVKEKSQAIMVVPKIKENIKCLFFL